MTVSSLEFDNRKGARRIWICLRHPGSREGDQVRRHAFWRMLRSPELTAAQGVLQGQVSGSSSDYTSNQLLL
jgi:hypothetical protein